MIPPRELRDCKQWLNWRNEDGAKIPRTADGGYGKSNDSSTWSTYKVAAKVAGKFSGIAFVFTADDPYCGIDLDNCLDEKGNLLPWAIPFIDKFSNCGFGEISPSGRGIKFITRGKKPDGARCVHVVNAELKQQVECYDHARFWTIRDESGTLYSNCREIKEGQREIDWLCEGFLIGRPQKPPVDKPTQPVQESQERYIDPEESLLERRAKGYVVAMPLVDSNRNNTLFKLAGNLQKLVEDGQRLSPDQIEAYCREWNNSLPEPLDEKEFEKTVWSGQNNGTPREDAPSITTDLTPNPNVDFSKLTFGCTPPKNSKTKNSGQIPLEMIYEAPGLIGGIVRWMDATCLYSLPELFFGSALGIMSVITGRKVCDPLDNRTNLFILSMGLTGCGKDHGRQQTKALFMACNQPDMIAPEDLGSSAGLAQRLMDHPSTLFQIDEFGYFLEQLASDKAQSYLKSIESDLLKLYSSANSQFKGRAYADVERTPSIDQPHCVLVGSCTPQTLWEAMSSKQVHAGLLGRLHVFEAPGYVKLTDDVPVGRPKMVPPPELVEGVKKWIEFSPGGNLSAEHPQPRMATWTVEAHERLIGHMRAIADKRIGEDSVAAAIWSRSAEKANKLALLAAAANHRFEVDIDDANWAIALQNCLTRKLVNRVGANLADNPFERLKQRVLSKIPVKMSLTEIRRKTQFLRNGKERNDILEELHGSGQLLKSEVTGKTRPTIYYEPPGE